MAALVSRFSSIVFLKAAKCDNTPSPRRPDASRRFQFFKFCAQKQQNISDKGKNISDIFTPHWQKAKETEKKVNYHFARIYDREL